MEGAPPAHEEALVDEGQLMGKKGKKGKKGTPGACPKKGARPVWSYERATVRRHSSERHDGDHISR